MCLCVILICPRVDGKSGGLDYFALSLVQAAPNLYGHYGMLEICVGVYVLMSILYASVIFTTAKNSNRGL